MSTTKHEINQALVDVRNAYRLLYDYQRAAMDAAGYIGNQLGYRYSGGCGRFSEMLKFGKGSLEDWAWYTLNMMLFEFNFSPDEESKDVPDLLVWLASDTGYFDSKDPAVIQTDMKTFKAAEYSATKIAFLFYRDWPDAFDGVYGSNPRIGNNGGASLARESCPNAWKGVTFSASAMTSRRWPTNRRPTR